MLNLSLIFICLGFGFYLRRFENIKTHGPEVLNKLIIDLFLPALIFAFIPNLTGDLTRAEIVFPALMPWLMFFMAWVFIIGLGKIFSWNKSTIGVLVLVAGLGNTSFVGFPLLEALYGPKSLATGIVVDQLGSFLIVATLATVFGIIYSGGKATAKMLVQRVLHFPPFISLVISLCLIPFGPYEKLSAMLLKLSAPMVPLAIISLALQLNTSVNELKINFKEVTAALLFKLFLFPVSVLFLYVFIFKQRGEVMQITLSEAAMAPMFSASILATRFDLRPELSSLIIFIGVLLSLVTVPIWAHFSAWI